MCGFFVFAIACNSFGYAKIWFMPRFDTGLNYHLLRKCITLSDEKEIGHCPCDQEESYRIEEYRRVITFIKYGSKTLNFILCCAQFLPLCVQRRYFNF